jgi:hypothetical protein
MVGVSLRASLARFGAQPSPVSSASVRVCVCVRVRVCVCACVFTALVCLAGRLHDTSPSDMLALLEGRSTATRLAGQHRQLTATSTWLNSRLGLDHGLAELGEGRGLGRRLARSPSALMRSVSGAALRTRWRRWVWRVRHAERQPRPVAARDGFVAMESGIF